MPTLLPRPQPPALLEAARKGKQMTAGKDGQTMTGSNAVLSQTGIQFFRYFQDSVFFHLEDVGRRKKQQHSGEATAP